MNRLKVLHLLVAAFFGFFSPPINAQFNLKSGYNLSFLSSPGLDEVIADFNKTQPYTKPMSNLDWVHGFELGARFKSGAHALELVYQGGYQVLNAEGDANGGSAPYKDKMRFSVQGAAIGYQVTGEVAGIGAELQYQWYTNKVDLGLTDENFKNVQTTMGLRVYLVFIVPGSRGVDLAIQPYMVIPLDTYDLVPLSQYLQQEPNTARDKWTRFGLTVSFYNGQK
jgi:hypothetical protein